MKAHQAGVVGAVAVTQQIPSDLFFAQLAIEPQSCLDFLLRGPLAVGGVAEGVGLAIDDFTNDGLTAVGCQQYYPWLAAVVWINRFGVTHTGIFAEVEQTLSFTRLSPT
ncbi:MULTISPECIES: hypothetical protein [unclassified Pseudomonas]|jgi:hypothetical protein|uniref:hypothetical protein n=1 Tax=Pseudomonas sp. A-R-26 TaxID=2832404 RepID=UPI001CC03A84|nr:hypothetical protein [Pseudomonas sp. A-R-26]